MLKSIFFSNQKFQSFEVRDSAEENRSTRKSCVYECACHKIRYHTRSNGLFKLCYDIYMSMNRFIVFDRPAARTNHLKFIFMKIT